MGSAANPQSAVHNVFVYGSLLADDVVRALLNRVPPSSPATLPNYHRFSIRGRVYPAILPVESKKVNGKVLLGITPPELHILDEFEDVEYERRTVDVFLTDTSEKLQAYTYVWENKTDPNLYGEWDFEACHEGKIAYLRKRMNPGFIYHLIRELPAKSSYVTKCQTTALVLQIWKQLHKEDFLKMTIGFAEEMELPDPKRRVETHESFYPNADDSPSNP